MPAPYRLYYVATWSTVPGKMPQAMEWYRLGMGLWPRLPGVLSVQGLTQQFGLGPDGVNVEIWFEIEDYGALDQWDAVDGQLAAEWLEVVAAAAGCVTPGPARLMGDLAGSVPSPLGGDLAVSAPSG